MHNIMEEELTRMTAQNESNLVINLVWKQIRKLLMQNTLNTEFLVFLYVIISISIRSYT